MMRDGPLRVGRGGIPRREFAKLVLAGSVGLALPQFACAEDEPFKFGLTPVFLSSDLELLGHLRSYLASRMGGPVELVSRRTYQEITALLVSGQIHGAWICGYPYVQYKADLDLVATPVWHGKPLYQSYLIAASGRSVDDWTELEGDIHAFSDPDSNSGFLVTRALFAENSLPPGGFFSRTFFTYGHRNVIRAVASGLAQSGSVDGYVFDGKLRVCLDLVGVAGGEHASVRARDHGFGRDKRLIDGGRAVALKVIHRFLGLRRVWRGNWIMIARGQNEAT